MTAVGLLYRDSIEVISLANFIHERASAPKNQQSAPEISILTCHLAIAEKKIHMILYHLTKEIAYE